MKKNTPQKEPRKIAKTAQKYLSKLGDPKDTRPSWDEYFMAITDVIGTRGTCDRGRAASSAFGLEEQGGFGGVEDGR